MTRTGNDQSCPRYHYFRNLSYTLCQDPQLAPLHKRADIAVIQSALWDLSPSPEVPRFACAQAASKGPPATPCSAS